MSLPPVVVDDWNWPSASTGATAVIRVEAVRVGDSYLEIAVHVKTGGAYDGPCVNLTPDQARQLSDSLRTRADLIDAISRAQAVHGGEAPF